MLQPQPPLNLLLQERAAGAGVGTGTLVVIGLGVAAAVGIGIAASRWWKQKKKSTSQPLNLGAALINYIFDMIHLNGGGIFSYSSAIFTC